MNCGIKWQVTDFIEHIASNVLIDFKERRSSAQKAIDERTFLKDFLYGFLFEAPIRFLDEWTSGT